MKIMKNANTSMTLHNSYIRYDEVGISMNESASLAARRAVDT